MEQNPNRKKNYYEKYGMVTDLISRCMECRSIVTGEILSAKGCCPKCGNKRVTEVTTLSGWEWLKIKLGIIRFEHSDEFLAEFSNGK